MSDLNLIFTVVNRNLEKDYVSFFRKNGIEQIECMLANGTATKSVLDYLGIENTQKVMLQMVVTGSTTRLFSELVSRMGINLPGTGIAMSIPVESVAGSMSLAYLTKGQEKKTSEGTEMENLYSLITVVAEKGCTDMVMDAAREAGARGGTVVHAKGTGTEAVAKFFGVSISPEKELIYIATRKADRSGIMKAIMEKAGPSTEAKAVVFSLPVEEIVGLTALTELKENE